MMVRMVGGWVFLLVPAHPGSPGQRVVKRLLLLLCTVLPTSSCLYSLNGTSKKVNKVSKSSYLMSFTSVTCCLQLTSIMTTTVKAHHWPHDTLLSGHRGAAKTVSRVQQEFYWSGIHNFVTRYVASCDLRQRNVSKGSIGKAPMGKLPLVGTAAVEYGCSASRLEIIRSNQTWL